MFTANLALRFFLELAALGGFASLAWRLSNGHWRYLASVVIVLIIAAVWGTFAVPNDPSRSGNAPVPVSGMLRLALEGAILIGGALAFYLAGHSWAGLSVAGLTLVHYSLWTDRIVWLLQQ